MNTEQLRTFLSLVETQNFSRTAQQLLVSQSTVSKRIKELEKETQQELFIRSKSGVKLSNAGSAFYGHARQIINIEERAIEQINRTNLYTGYLVLGVAFAYYDLYLCPILKKFLALHSEISIRMRSAHTGQLLNELRQAKIDIAYTHYPYSHPDYINEKVAEDEIVLVTDFKNDEFKDGIPYMKMKDLPLIHSNFLYSTTFHWLFPHNHHFQLETDIASDALPLISGQHWYAIFPRKMVSSLLIEKNVREIPVLDGELPPVLYYMIYRKESIKQSAVKEWLSFYSEER